MPSLPSPRQQSRPRLEIIPFIDIMFFLLATFMMVSLSMIKNEGMSVNLPRIVAPTRLDHRSVVVTITDTEDLYLDKDLLTQADLNQRLLAMRSNDPELQVLINGDANALFGKAVEVLDEIRSLGITRVSIQTARKHVDPSS